MTDGLLLHHISRKTKQHKSTTWCLVTSVPDFDGYQWRKYGQKQIEGAIYPRFDPFVNNSANSTLLIWPIFVFQ